MRSPRRIAVALSLSGFTLACAPRVPAPAPPAAAAAVASDTPEPQATPRPEGLKPILITDRVAHDSGDPAIWIHPTDRAKSLVLGTDKNVDGSLYTFGLDGRIVKRIKGLKRPSNVDVEYGVSLGNERVDIAVVSERLGDAVRVYKLPGLDAIGGGPIPVFEGQAQKGPMGVGIYKRPGDDAVFVILSRKTGPRGSYLWQYRVESPAPGELSLEKVREFGTFSGGEGEIEAVAVAVDDDLGYVYYSDEGAGVRKYRADPDAPDAATELALFGADGFAQDREGISIYKIDGGTGYILVSDPQANQFRVFPREGSPGRSHDHRLLKVVPTSAIESDGSDVTSLDLSPRFPAGLFVAMSEGGTFHFYSWPQIAGTDLKVARNESGGR